MAKEGKIEIEYKELKRKKGVGKMANQVENKLIKPLFDELQKERFITIATVDYETGSPDVNAISWVLAKNEKIIYFAIDSRSRMVQNIKQNQKAVINLIANESTYSIKGEVNVKLDNLNDVPLKLSLIEMRITEVRDVMFYGSKIVNDPQYDKTYDRKAAVRLDQQVMDAMKKA